MAERSKPERSVIQAPRFGRAKRWLPAAAQEEVDNTVRSLMSNPLLGEQKSGALRDVRVVKLKVGAQQLLLAYQFSAKTNVIEVLDVGPHENFYRELQKYLNAR
jgi:hypothetical protein